MRPSLPPLPPSLHSWLPNTHRHQRVRALTVCFVHALALINSPSPSPSPLPLLLPLPPDESSPPGEPPEVTADHPDVQRAVTAAEQKARSTPPELTQEMYMEALRTGVEAAEERRRKMDPQGPKLA